MKKIEEIIGYSFKNRQYLSVALTHSSYSNEHNTRSYERLEFLGDSVLSLIVSEYLFEKMKKNDEGDLSRIRASVVCEETLASLSRKMGFGDYIYLGKGEEKAGSKDKDSILSDVFESVLAAIYLDSDLETARKYILNIMSDTLNDAVNNSFSKDYKTKLQEEIQRKTHGKTKIQYVTVGESGPEHMKNFDVELRIDDKVISSGTGRSKKEAEQNAAKKIFDEKLYRF